MGDLEAQSSLAPFEAPLYALNLVLRVHLCGSGLMDLSCVLPVFESRLTHPSHAIVCQGRRNPARD
jgi:hypothetical protein